MRGGHKVHFSYWLHDGVWCYRFIGDGLKPLGAVRRTRNPDDIRTIAERGNALPNLEAKLMLDYGIQTGQGGTSLRASNSGILFLMPLLYLNCGEYAVCGIYRCD